MTKNTPKVRAFVEHYLASGNAKAAARAAGYKGKPHTLEVQGSALLRKPEVRALIDAAQSKVSSKRIADATEVQEHLTATMRNKKLAAGERTQAAIVLARIHGLFIAKDWDPSNQNTTFVFLCPQPAATAEEWAKSVRAERIT